MLLLSREQPQKSFFFSFSAEVSKIQAMQDLSYAENRHNSALQNLKHTQKRNGFGTHLASQGGGNRISTGGFSNCTFFFSKKQERNGNTAKDEYIATIHAHSEQKKFVEILKYKIKRPSREQCTTFGYYNRECTVGGGPPLHPFR